MRVSSGADVRAVIARLVLGDDAVGRRLGEVRLHDHQRQAVGRLERVIAEHGGALLADDVGLGKTFVALALAARADTLVIAPAGLRHAWLESAKRAGVAIRFHSVELLSRAATAPRSGELVIIDEAHHLRSTATRRFRLAAALCRSAKVLLLTATPVQNRIGDLRAMLSLFLGERAMAMTMEEMSRLIVRRVSSDIALVGETRIPTVEAPVWLPVVDDVNVLDRLVALPPPVPPADGDDAGVLLTYTLARQWASSRAALVGALRRRLARGLAMADALGAGRLPSRTELKAWCFADGAQQLSFVDLVVDAEATHAAALRDQVAAHVAAVRQLLGWLRAQPDPDIERARILATLLRQREGERIVAFSEYADTIGAYYRVLASAARVAMLTHGGGRVAGGRVSRRELLECFAPEAARRTRDSERIDLLLTTDVLSEGVSLHDASVVVHLDLGWNPARLEQRVGRLRRIGATRDTVAVFLFAPPAPTERLLQLQTRLRAKLAEAARSVGLAGSILPDFTVAQAATTAVSSHAERVTALLASWSAGPDVEPPVAAAIHASRSGAVACVKARDGVRLVAVIGARITTDPRVVADLLALADGEDVPVDAAEAHAFEQRLVRWFHQRHLLDAVAPPMIHVARARRSVLHRVDAIARRAPRHSRARMAPLMRAARAAAVATLPAGAERVLDELARAPMPDDVWLHAVGEFATLHARPAQDVGAVVLALLVLRTNGPATLPGPE